MIPLLLTDLETISKNEAFESHGCELNTNANIDRHKFVNISSFIETEFQNTIERSTNHRCQSISTKPNQLVVRFLESISEKEMWRHL